MNTHIQRKTHGDKSWEAETYEEITIKNKPAKLIGSTYKTAYNGQLVSTINVAWIVDENCTRHTLFEDFNKTIFTSKPKRVTSKAVEDQHYEQIRLKWDAIKAAAQAFYASKTLNESL